ncbi:hypothetical protein [Pedobacter aquatilis]|uniref:hypothetical protein n=1 Tax=Pedobacter aquatilis TaxID=351343 RepID=UPI00292CB7A9|nr:hypothetical protein [Pedobacter aquatilis]
MIQKVIILALVTNFLLMNPVYQLLVQNLPKKPFTCSFCIGWWIGIGYTLITMKPENILVAAASAVVATLIDRYLNSLPIKLK